MAVTVEELQILLSCDATQAETVLDQLTSKVDKAVAKMNGSINNAASGAGAKGTGGKKTYYEKVSDKLKSTYEQLDKAYNGLGAGEKGAKENFGYYIEQANKLTSALQKAGLAADRALGTQTKGGAIGRAIENMSYLDKSAKKVSDRFNKMPKMDEYLAGEAPKEPTVEYLGSTSKTTPFEGWKPVPVSDLNSGYVGDMMRRAQAFMNSGVGDVSAKLQSVDTSKLTGGSEYEQLAEKLKVVENQAESLRQKIANIGDASANPQALMTLQTKLETAERKAEKLAQKMAEIEDSVGQGDGASAGVSESGEAADEATPKIEEYNRALAETGATSNNVGKKLPEVSKNITKHANAFQKLGQMFKRVLLYRAIRSLIQSITRAIQEGYKNAYEYSKQSSGEASKFAKALDSVKSASLTMKNQLGAAFSSLVASIAPAITAVINMVTRLAKVISQLFALMGGSSTYMSAVEGLDATGEAASGAGGKVKGLLADFDELNIIGQQGGGGGGGGGLSASQMFEEIPVDSKLKEMFDISGVPESIERLLEAWDRLKKAFENTNFSWAINTFLLDPLRTVIDTATDIINIITSILNGDAFGTALGIGSLIFNSLVNTVVIPFTRLIDAIFGTNLTGKVLDFKNKVNEGTSLLFNEDVRAEVFKKMKEPFEKAWEKVKEIWDTVATWFDENVVQPIVDFFAPIVTWLGTFFKGAWQIIRAVWVVVADWFNDNVWTPIKDFFTEAW